MISTDKKILEENSEVRQRMVEYGGLVEEMHIIVFTKRNFQFSIFNFQKKTNLKISENTFVYPTNSRSKLFYIRDTIRIGEKIIGNSSGKFLVTSQDPFETGFVGWRLAKKFKLPLQIQAHTDFLSPYFAKESRLNKIRVLLGKFLVKRANSIRVVSERIKQSLLAISHKPLAITVLPIFVDKEKIKNAPIKTSLREKYPQFDFIILMASRFSREKNIELAISGFREILPIYPKVGLIIVGSGPEKKNYESRIKNYGLGKNVLIESWSEDLISYYKTADFFLLTSNYEGYGRTLIETAVAGCKIISSDVGVAPEILEKENLFPPGDKNQLVEKIIDAISGGIKPTKGIVGTTKEAHLLEYKKSWEMTFLRHHGY